MNTTTKRMLAASAVALSLTGLGINAAMAQSTTPVAPTASVTHQGLPPGFHWSKTTRQMDDCGPRNKGQVKFIIWRGDSDTSVLFCPNGTAWPS